MQAGLAAELEAFLEDLLTPNVPPLKTSDRLDIRNRQYRVGHNIILDIHEVPRRSHHHVAQDRAFRRNDRALRPVVLRREQPEFMMIGTKLAALLTNAALPKDKHLFPPAQRVHHDSPFFEGDVGSHLHNLLTT